MGVVMPRILTPLLLLAVLLAMPANATTTLGERLGGRVQARVDGETVFFPTLRRCRRVAISKLANALDLG